MTEYERLLDDANSCHSYALTRLADCCAEMGDDVRANGYRWLRDNERWPYRSGASGGRYVWCDGGPTGREWNGSNAVPSLAWRALKEKLTIGCQPGEFTSESAAIDAGAKAVGEWLAKQEAPAKPERGRTRSEVLAARQNAVGGGCCNRFADYKSCTCLDEALPDPEETSP